MGNRRDNKGRVRGEQMAIKKDFESGTENKISESTYVGDASVAFDAHSCDIAGTNSVFLLCSVMTSC